MSEEVIESTVVEPAAVPAAPAPAPAPVAAPVAAPAEAPAAAPAEPASTLSDNWREIMAGAVAETATADEKAEHSKLLDRLKRMNSPADVAKALRSQDKLISSGQLKRALGKDATPEQVAEYRKSNGIPESADKYDLAVPAGIELNDLDQVMLKGWADKAFAVNATPEQVKAGTAAYFETRAAIAEKMTAANNQAKLDAADELRAEWGSDYRSNTDGLSTMLGQFDSAASEAIINARTPDGVQILNNPAVVRALAAHARELGFVGATVVPSGGDAAKGIGDRLGELKKMMADENSPYRKGPQANALQEEYRMLVNKQDRLAKM